MPRDPDPLTTDTPVPDLPRLPQTGRVDGLIPFVQVKDVQRSVDFYALLGFEVEGTHNHDDQLDWAALRTGAGQIMLARAAAPIRARDQAVLFYLYSPDLHALREHLLTHGARPGPIVDGSPGPDQELRICDPDGYCLMIAQR